MKKSNFEELIPEITNIAKGLSSFWSNKFEANELVNEAWIKRKRLKSTDIPLILRRAKFDMIDYIRIQEGRLQSFDKDGEKIKKYKPKHMTNIVFTNNDNEEQKANIFDRPIEDKNFLSLENKELIDILLEELTEKQLKSISLYYLKGKTFKEAAEVMGNKECSSFRLVKKGLNRCRRKLETMNI